MINWDHRYTVLNVCFAVTSAAPSSLQLPLLKLRWKVTRADLVSDTSVHSLSRLSVSGLKGDVYQSCLSAVSKGKQSLALATTLITMALADQWLILFFPPLHKCVTLAVCLSISSLNHWRLMRQRAACLSYWLRSKASLI